MFNKDHHPLTSLLLPFCADGFSCLQTLVAAKTSMVAVGSSLSPINLPGLKRRISIYYNGLKTTSRLWFAKRYIPVSPYCKSWSLLTPFNAF
jgi:hypothetical protein